MRTSPKRAGIRPGDIVALALAAVVLFPVFYGLCGAFKSPAEFAAWPPAVLPRSFGYTENFRRVFEQAPMMRYFANSLAVAMLSTSVRLLLAVLAAYAFVFYDFPGHKLLFFLMLGTMMLPADTLVITNYQTVTRMGLLDTYLGMSIVSFVGASQMFMLRQTFLTSPRTMREAALIDGCGDLRFIFSILVPAVYPLLLMLFLQSFLAQWNAYLWPLLVTNRVEMRTVQVGLTMLTTFESTNYETILAGVAIVMAPTALLFIVLRGFATRAMNDGPLLS